LQRLQPVAGQSFVFYNLNASSNVVQSGTATADALGLITVTNFQIGSGSNRLVLTTESVAPLTPTAQWPDLLLTWPSFFYEVFRVEHRPLLETGTWLPLTTNLPAANPATNTTYLHPGVLTEPSGFYRVQRRP
jgi:hypothetical protein